MELRKVEQELDALTSEWKAIRRKRPQFNSEEEPAEMPSWSELKSAVKDDEIFPPEEQEDISMKDDCDVVIINDDSGTANNNNETGADAADNVGYSDFGMCLAPSVNDAETAKDATEENNTGGSSVWERYAAKNTISSTKPNAEHVKVEEETTKSTVDDAEEEEMKVEDASPNDILAGLESLQKRLVTLEPKIDKFLSKLNGVSLIMQDLRRCNMPLMHNMFHLPLSHLYPLRSFREIQ